MAFDFKFKAACVLSVALLCLPPAVNKSICKSRAGQSNISYLQASAEVPADEFQLGFYLLSSTLYFQSAFVPGRTSNESPAFANTRPLAVIWTDLTTQRLKNCFYTLLK